MNKRDSNQGTCTNACRWKYNVTEGCEDEVGHIAHKHAPIPAKEINEAVAKDITNNAVFMLEEANRPGEYMSAFEDEHGTYIMNSKDLRAVELIDSLVNIGVHSLKIEGRTKSFYYCARTAQVYRKTIDDAAAGKPFDIELLTALDALANRGYTEGFLRRHRHEETQNYKYGYSMSEKQQFVGEFTGKQIHGLAEVAVKNKFFVGDSVEMMTPKGNVHFTVENMKNCKGQSIEVGLGDGHIVYLAIPDNMQLDYALLMRDLQGKTPRDPHK